jgi:hypothetical protein
VADDLFDFLDSAEPTHAAAEPAPDAETAPDEASPPPDDQAEQPSEADDSSEGETPEAETAALEQPTADAESEPEPPVDWRTLPEAQALIQEAEQMRQLRAVAEQAKALQAQQALARTIDDLSEGDSERHGQLLNVLAQVAQPLQAQAQAHEQRATQSEKALTAFLVAAQAKLDPTQLDSMKGMFQQLMAVEGPELMERLAFADRDAEKQYTPKLAAAEQKIAELEKRLAATVRNGARSASGADAIDSGRGLPAAKQAGADTFDDFFTEMWAGGTR